MCFQHQPERIITLQHVDERKRAELARRRTESALLESEQRLLMALTASNTIAWSWDLQTGAVTQSDNAPVILGLPSSIEESAGWNLVHADDAPLVRETIERAIAARNEYSFDARIVRADTGETRWLQYRGKVEADAVGEPVRIIGTRQRAGHREDNGIGITMG
jgi:PAS domain-containing protein